jgi:hypothetical protein
MEETLKDDLQRERFLGLLDNAAYLLTTVREQENQEMNLEARKPGTTGFPKTSTCRKTTK